MTKIFIIAPEHIDKLSVANAIVGLNDDMNVCKMFTSEKDNSGLIGEYMFYLDVEDVILAFKNNALLFIDYRDDKITGITLDDFDSSDVIMINTAHFNTISDVPFIDEDQIFVWLDTKNKVDDKIRKRDLLESRYLQERIDELNIPTMYFVDEDPLEVAKIVLDYVYGNDEHRKELLEENS